MKGKGGMMIRYDENVSNGCEAIVNITTSHDTDQSFIMHNRIIRIDGGMSTRSAKEERRIYICVCVRAVVRLLCTINHRVESRLELQ